MERFLIRERNNVSKLFAGLLFLRISGRDVFSYKILYPSIMSLLMIVGMWSFSEEEFKFSTEILHSSMQFLSIMLGFYMAALAAVASFGQELLDQNMQGDTPIITRRVGIVKIKEELTRRKFLCALFGYAACLSLLLILFGSGLKLIDGSIWDLAPDNAGEIAIDKIHIFVFFPYLWMFSSLFVVSLLGIYYLADRMHRS